MIICCGEALIDMIRGPVSSSGNEAKMEGFLPSPGGSPYNTAIAIGKIGAPVKYLGRLSTDFFGEILIKKLRENRVGLELTSRTALNSTIAFIKLAKGKEPDYVFYTEYTANFSMKPEDLPAKLPSDTNCILFGSIAMTVEPISSAIEALILAEGTRKSADQMDGAPVISFDPNVRPYMIKNMDAYREKFEKWVATSTIVKISQKDFEFIYPKLSFEQALQKMLTMGPRLVIGTMGSRGAQALLRKNDGSVIKASVPALNLPVVDTIGAGDTFHGAFLAWLEIKKKMSRSALAGLSETELNDALLFANKAAALVCSRSGAVPPSLREIQSLKVPQVKNIKKTAASQKAKAPSAKKPAAKPKAAVPKKPSAKKSEAKRPSAKSMKKPAAKKTTPAKKPADKERKR